MKIIGLGITRTFLIPEKDDGPTAWQDCVNVLRLVIALCICFFSICFFLFSLLWVLENSHVWVLINNLMTWRFLLILKFTYELKVRINHLEHKQRIPSRGRTSLTFSAWRKKVSVMLYFVSSCWIDYINECKLVKFNGMAEQYEFENTRC